MEPERGRWTADVICDTKADLTGQLTLEIEGVEWVGTVHRGGVESTRWVGRLVGGAGGIHQTVDAKSYFTVTLKAVLDDILSETGETLSTDAVSLAGQTVAHWSRTRGAASWALQSLADALGYDWRIERDGTLWLGDIERETLELEDAWTQLSANYIRGVRVIAPRRPTVRPGVVFDGVPVVYVTTRASGDGIRQELSSS